MRAACLVMMIASCRGKSDEAGFTAPASAPTPPPAAAATPPPAPAVDPHRISPAGIGPIAIGTAVTDARLAQLVPELHWDRQDGNDAEGNPMTSVIGSRGDKPVLGVILGDDARTIVITASVPGYATAAGIEVGADVAALVKAYPDLQCKFEETEVDELICTTAALAHITFHISLHGKQLRTDKVAPSTIANRRIEEIAVTR